MSATSTSTRNEWSGTWSRAAADPPRVVGGVVRGDGSGRYRLWFRGRLSGIERLRIVLAHRLPAEEPPAAGADDAEWVLALWRACAGGPGASVADAAEACGFLAGSWAFALWDAERRLLALATDRFARRRMYYGWTPEGLRFATDPAAFVPAPNRSTDLDPDAVGLYFQLRYFPPPVTPWRGLHWLFPGTVLLLGRPDRPEAFSPWPRPPSEWFEDDGPLSPADPRPVRPAYHAAPMSMVFLDGLYGPDFAVRGTAPDPASAAERVLAELDGAMDGYGPGGDAFGAMLSGGVDSSLVAAWAAERARRRGAPPPRTWCVGYDGCPEDESAHAGAVAAALGVRHTTINLGAAEALEAARAAGAGAALPYAAGSLVPLAAAGLRIRGEAAGCWTGDGGDELFAGYRRYALMWRHWSWLRCFPGRRWAAWALAAMPEGWWDGLARAGGRWTPDGVRRRGGAVTAKELAQWIGARDPADFYARLVRASGDDGSVAVGGRRGTAEAFWRDFAAWAGALPPAEPWRGSTGAGAARSMTWMDQSLYLPGDGVTKLDVAARTSGLRLVPPLLDDRMAAWAAELSAAALFDRGGGKKPLRAALARLVDLKRFSRPKSGFGAPLGVWLSSPSWRAWADELAAPEQMKAAGLDRQTLAAWRGEAEAGSRGAAARWWSALVFLDWQRR